MIDNDLKEYIETNILTKYNSNDKGHGIDHIKYVINRSLNFAKLVDNINLDMVYTIAAYHDIGHSIDPKNHESISAKILLNDSKLLDFFTDEELIIMSMAIEDHRASLESEPRNIYGKIVSSADRNTNIIPILKRTYEYRIKHSNAKSLKEIIEESYEHLVEKFGNEGYANKKMYFEDDEYKKFLEDIQTLLNDKNEFYKMYIKVNNLENEFLKKQLEMYTPFNEQESIDKQTFLTFIDTFDDVLTRKNIFGHLTASAFVVNEDFTKSLIVNHNIFGGFIYSGGHADGEFDLLSVAIREVEEETGLKVIPLINGDIFALQALPIKGHVKKGKYVSAHIHYDVLYLLLAKNSDMNNIMEQFNKMLQNNEFSDDLKKALNSFKNSSNNSNKNSNSSNSTIPDIDINTFLKIKQVMESMNSNKNDPRNNLLMSLKPYLRESRKKKVDQYIQLFGLGKAFEVLNSLGGENKNDV